MFATVAPSPRSSVAPLRRGGLAVLALAALVLAACGADPAGSDVEGDATGLDADAGTADLGPTPDVAADSALSDTADADETSSDVLPDGAPSVCAPGAAECRDGLLATCVSEGDGWLVRECPNGGVCVAGACPAPICEPGSVLCAVDARVICDESGTRYTEEPCDAGLACFDGECIECLREEDCGDGDVCDEGACVPAPVHVLTEALDPAMVGVTYSFSLEAAGGRAPYEWTVSGGALPAGVLLSTSGVLAGTPTTASEGEVTVAVRDADRELAGATYTWQVLPPGVAITTTSLPDAEEGFDYEVQLQALGGTEPYAWMIVEGELPAGLTLTSDGRVVGVPSAVGDFPLTVRVFDRATPPGYDDQALSLHVAIAPLTIVGDQSYNLFITTVVVLPLMIPIEGIPVPYETQLTARGGLRPYHWAESTALTGAIAFLIPTAGIPDGLTLDEDGRLHGSVTDTSQVFRLAIPFTAIELTGFFFFAAVTDSQETPASASGVFLIPTVPIGG